MAAARTLLLFDRVDRRLAALGPVSAVAVGHAVSDNGTEAGLLFMDAPCPGKPADGSRGFDARRGRPGKSGPCFPTRGRLGWRGRPAGKSPPDRVRDPNGTTEMTARALAGPRIWKSKRPKERPCLPRRGNGPPSSGVGTKVLQIILLISFSACEANIERAFPGKQRGLEESRGSLRFPV